jgi:hypothetical protein
MTQLTPNFTLERLCASSTALRLGIDNTPPENLIANARRLAEGLEEVQRVLGFSLHHDSGYRCPELNAAVHGVPTSQHTKFEAEDFTCPQFGTPLEIVKLISGSTIHFDQLIAEGNWCHVSFTETPRREVLTAHFLGGKVTYTAGLGEQPSRLT